MNDHLFGNDPDVFLLRDDNIKLSLEQRKALTKINALFGSLLLTSDDIANYDKEKKDLLEEAFEIFEKATDVRYQTKGNIIRIYYELDKKEYALAYNTRKGVFIHE